MIRKLAGLLRLTARDLEELSGSTPQDSAPEEPEGEPAASSQAEPTPPETTGTPPPPHLWTRFFSRERDRMRWLRHHPRVIGIGLVLAVTVVLIEKWLIMAWYWIVAQVRLYGPNLASHPVALIGVGAILFYLAFGLQWLRSLDDFVRWVWGGIKRHPRLSALVGSLLFLIGLWLANNHGTWIVLPFTVGHTETTPLNGEKAAVQLIAELNQVGVGNPTQVLILWELREPRTSSGSVTARRNLPLEECDVILRGPGDFTASRRIPLPRVLTGSQGSRLDLGNLSIGTISIPSQIFTQFILKVLPTGYREFNGQINENKGQLEISVSSSNPPHAWRVAGPSSTYPEMMEYLALRMALDLNPELVKSSGLDAAPSDRELAFAMGNQAFRQQHYERAYAFFRLADQFAPLDEKVDAMLGLTHYHLALKQLDDDTSHLDAALQAMEAAIREDPNADSSLLRPYMACLYQKVGLEEQAQVERTVFTQYLLRLEFQDREVRVNALKQLPLHGPGRHLSVAGNDVIFVDEEGTIVGAAGQPSTIGLSLPNQNPRQIELSGNSRLLFISADGAVLAYDYQASGNEQTPTTLVEGRTLSGVQQIGASASQFGRTNLFLLNRFGQIYWCELEAKTGSASACPPRQPLVADLSDVRQILPIEDRLYILAPDGAVWYTEVNVSGHAFAPRQLTSPAQVQEISFASDGTLYLLHDNGNVWRYYEDGRPETEDLKLIDQGTNTAQIFAGGSYLYLLKSTGAVWRISNPRNPTPANDFVEISMPPGNAIVQEMFVTAEATGKDTASSRTIHLLTDQRVLLQGTDTGETRVAIAPINVPNPTQTNASP